MEAKLIHIGASGPRATTARNAFTCFNIYIFIHQSW